MNTNYLPSSEVFGPLSYRYKTDVIKTKRNLDLETNDNLLSSFLTWHWGEKERNPLYYEDIWSQKDTLEELCQDRFN